MIWAETLFENGQDATSELLRLRKPVGGLKQRREIAEVLRLPDVTARLSDISATPVGSLPEEARAFIRRDAARWREVIVSAGIRLE